MNKKKKISLSLTTTLVYLVISGFITLTFFMLYYSNVSKIMREQELHNLNTNLEHLRILAIDNVNTWIERVRLSSLSVVPYLSQIPVTRENLERTREMMLRVDGAQEDFTRINCYSNNRWTDPGGFYLVTRDNFLPSPEYDNTVQPWFMKAKAARGNVVFNGPFQSSVTGEAITLASIDIIDSNGNSLGVMSGVVLTRYLTDMLVRSKRYENQKTIIINREGNYIADEDYPDPILTGDFFRDYDLENRRYDILNSPSRTILTEDKIICSAYIPMADWYILTMAPKSILEESILSLLIKMASAAIIVFVISSVLVAFLTRHFITRPIKEAEFIAESLAAQDFSVSIQTGRLDEIGSMQEAFVKIRDNLNGTIQTLNNDLIIAKERAEMERDKAESANRAKSNFLASMSHEIRTPMNAIIGMSELIRTDNFDKTQRNYFSDIRKMTHALLQIINDILDFSKIEAGRMELSPVHFNILDLYHNICSLTIFTTSGKSVIFNSSFSENIPEVIYADEIRIRQIIMNIVNNAVKYTRAGSVSLHLDYMQKNERGYMIITVKDTGVGIREEDLPKIFQAFEQADVRKNRGIMGTGLGLAITHKFVEMMNGNIEVQSRYGRGTTFTVTLPIVQGNHEYVKKEQNSNFVVTGPVSVLIIDDVPINLTVALGFLSTHGIGADTASGGVEAIEKIKEKNYDLVFMDHMMPEMDGVEATKAIRALYKPGDKASERFRDMPIVALTANAIAGMRDFFLQSGMNDFISKPIESAKLNEVLLKFLPSDIIRYNGESAESDESERIDGDTIISHLATVDGIDVEKGLGYLKHNTRLYFEMLGEFCENCSAYTAEISRLCDEKNWQGYAIKMHAIKGICAALVNENMRAWANKLELAARSGKTERCVSDTAVFCSDLNVFAEKVADCGLRRSVDGTPKVTVDRDIMKQKLETLLRHCEGVLHGSAGAVNSAEKCVTELSHLTYKDFIDNAVPDLGKLINDFEYEAAEVKLKEILIRFELGEE